MNYFVLNFTNGLLLTTAGSATTLTSRAAGS